jgi:hypothetical protein
MSVTMISPRAMIAPPPIPWTDLPTSIRVKLFAMAARREPSAKKKDATRIS